MVSDLNNGIINEHGHLIHHESRNNVTQLSVHFTTMHTVLNSAVYFSLTALFDLLVNSIIVHICSVWVRCLADHIHVFYICA